MGEDGGGVRVEGSARGPSGVLGAEGSFPKDRKPQPVVPSTEGGGWQGSLSPWLL